MITLEQTIDDAYTTLKSGYPFSINWINILTSCYDDCDLSYHINEKNLNLDSLSKSNFSEFYTSFRGYSSFVMKSNFASREKFIQEVIELSLLCEYPCLDDYEMEILDTAPGVIDQKKLMLNGKCAGCFVNEDLEELSMFSGNKDTIFSLPLAVSVMKKIHPQKVINSYSSIAGIQYHFRVSINRIVHSDGLVRKHIPLN